MNNRETRQAGNQSDQPSQPNQPNKRPKDKRRFSFYWIYAILFAVLIGLQFYGRDTITPTEKIDQGKFIELLKNSEVERIDLVNKQDAEVYLNQKGLSKHFPDVKATEKGTTTTPSYTYKIGDHARFEEMVEEAQQGFEKPVYISNVSRNNWAAGLLEWIIPFGLLIVFWIILMRGMGRGMGGAGSIFNIGKSRAMLYDKNTNVNVTFKDVAGLEEAKSLIF